jgi:hypothetical protein
MTGEGRPITIDVADDDVQGQRHERVHRALDLPAAPLPLVA